MSENKQVELDQLRHSAAHLLAAAVMELYPTAKRTIGPAIENGFYYDFDFGDIKITDTDLPKIEKKMRQLITTWKNFERHELSVDDVKTEFNDNEYKIGNIQDDSLLNLCNNEKFNYLREMQSKKGCGDIAPCNRCMRIYGNDEISKADRSLA